MSPRSLSLIESPSADSFERFRSPGGFAAALVHPFLPEAMAKNRLKYRESLALGYLTAALETSGYPVTQVNAELEFAHPHEVAERVVAVPDLGLLGISAKSQRTYRAARTIAELVKKQRPEVHVTLGGVFPSAAARPVLEDCAAVDSVVRGEGEYAIAELAWRLATGTPLSDMRGISHRDGERPVDNPDRSRIQNIDAVPVPARRDLEWILANGRRGGHSAYLVASRGCYASCTFCSIHQIYGDHGVVRRTPRNIVAEMRAIKESYGVTRFSFVDDLFIMPSPRGYQWVREFCDELEAAALDINFYAEMRADTIEPDFVRRLIDVGLHRIFIGVESGVDSVLKRWDKGTTVADNEKALRNLRGTDLPPHAINFGYIMFDPEMTLEELKQQYYWIRDSGYCRIQHLQNKMNIYWGTPQYRKMIRMGRVDNTPLGGRWQYEFDDWRVGDVEAAVRRFHQRYEAERMEPLTQAREAFLARVHEDRPAVDIPDWLFDLLNQVQRRLDAAERDLYYQVFERSFAVVERGERCDEAFDARLWDDLSSTFESLQSEAVLLKTFADSLLDLELRTDGCAPEPGSASVDVTTGTARVCLTSGPGPVGFLAQSFHRGPDRYSHACELDERLAV